MLHINTINEQNLARIVQNFVETSETLRQDTKTPENEVITLLT